MARAAISSELYRQLEPHLEILIKSSARKFAKTLDMPEEDVAQEARLAVYLALPRYEYNKSFGKIHSFARLVIRNALCSLAARATMESRMPRIVISEDGNLKQVRYRPGSLDDFNGTESHHQDLRALEDYDSDAKVEMLRFTSKLVRLENRLMKRLNARQKAVFQCLIRPSNELQLMARNKNSEVTNQLIAQYLEMSKNSVDWSLHIIKRHFTSLAETEFSALVEKALESRDWPMLYSSAQENDLDLIRKVIADRNLDPRPIEHMHTMRRGIHLARRIENYAWGSVVMLRYFDQVATVVIEGRFNEATGEVLADSGYWKPITDVFPDYKKLVRELGTKLL